jgi:hypothetical protein
MIKESRARLLPVTAVQWGPTWEDMDEAGKFLGEKGFMFDLHVADKRQGVDVMPDLVILDWRNCAHVVHWNDWVLVYPGYRQMRVVDGDTVLRETQQLSEEGE